MTHEWDDYFEAMSRKLKALQKNSEELDTHAAQRDDDAVVMDVDLYRALTIELIAAALRALDRFEERVAAREGAAVLEQPHEDAEDRPPAETARSVREAADALRKVIEDLRGQHPEIFDDFDAEMDAT